MECKSPLFNLRSKRILEMLHDLLGGSNARTTQTSAVYLNGYYHSV